MQYGDRSIASLRRAQPNGNTLEYLIPTEVTENMEEYQVRMMIPGIEPKLISLNATQKEIVIEAEQSRELKKGENVCWSTGRSGKPDVSPFPPFLQI